MSIKMVAYNRKKAAYKQFYIILNVVKASQGGSCREWACFSIPTASEYKTFKQIWL